MHSLKAVKWKWYHVAVFCLPGGMFLVGALITYQLKSSKGALQ